jgi:hypothetical protein
MILVRCTETLKGFGIVPHQNCANLLRNSSLQGIVFPHATSGRVALWG